VLGQKQVQKISQKLALSKNMQQSINILSMHTIDLKDFIEKEIIENPFLETEEVDYAHNEENYKNSQSTTDNNYDQDEVFSKLVDKTLTLKEHLINQINLTFQDDNEKFIAYYVTDMLDDNGYFRGLDESIAQELKISLTKFNSIMNILKTFDPIGVYSQNLEECLKLQAIEKNIYNSKFKKILENLNLVAKLDFKSLKKECEISEEELKELIIKLRKLNPKPGRDFLTNNFQIILPEIIIKGNKDQGFYPIINGKAVPNCFYQNNIDNKYLKPNEKSFCSKNKRIAIEVVSALTKRKKLLLNFADKILELQYEFLQMVLIF
jgi:RNA polymerase sigma-54 factor